MRKCPVCHVPLTHVSYEGVRVMQCLQCHGHLVPLARLEAVKRTDARDRTELRAEAESEFQGSTAAPVRCPRCGAGMEKRGIDIPVLDLAVDTCRHCAVAWLDGGELALLQLGYEASQKFLNAQDLKRRVQELEASPERKAQFRRNLARLPKGPDPLRDLLGEAVETLLAAMVCR